MEATPQRTHASTPSRRSFGQWIFFGTIGAIAAGLWALRAYYHSLGRSGVLIEGASELTVGNSLIFQYPTPNDPCLLIRVNEQGYVAYSRSCTHMGCPVFFRADDDSIACPCHGGVFSVTDGSVLAGPPPKPLPRILLERRDGNLYATGVANS